MYSSFGELSLLSITVDQDGGQILVMVWPSSSGDVIVLQVCPDCTQREVFQCDPVPMMNSAFNALERLGVPPTQIHQESFSFCEGDAPPSRLSAGQEGFLLADPPLSTYRDCNRSHRTLEWM